METGKKILQLTLFISIMWGSCVKDPQDIPGGLINDPAFGLTGSIDGQALNIEAGRNGWTMQPLVIEEDSAIAYTSLFSLEGCLDLCKPSLEFRFYRAQPASADEESNFFQTIKTGSKDFVLSHQERDSFEISLTTDPGLFMSGYSYWENLNGPATSYLAEYKDIFGFGELLNVCFQSLAYTGCQYNQCVYFDPATLVLCLSSIQPKLEDPRTISLTVRAEKGTPPFQVEWFDGHTSTSIVLPLQDSTVEIYAGVMVTDALGNRSELNQTIRLQNGIVDACYFPIDLISTPVPYVSSSFAADKVEIIYTDQDGVEWSNTSGIQPVNSNLSIGDVQYFGLSPLNEPAYKVALNLSVQLFNAITGESKLLITQGSTIALSY